MLSPVPNKLTSRDRVSCGLLERSPDQILRHRRLVYNASLGSCRRRCAIVYTYNSLVMLGIGYRNSTYL